MSPEWLQDLLERLLRCPALALDAEKNLLSAAGILAGGVSYTCVAALGGSPGTLTGNLFISIGLSLWILCVVVAAGGVSRGVLQELRGEPKIGILEAVAYLRRRWLSLVLTPLSFLALALGGLVAQTFIAIVGAIPGIGPILYALSFILNVAFSVLVILALGVLILGFPLYPAALEVREGGVGEVVREMAALFRRRLLRILLAEGVIVAASGVAALAACAMLGAALRITVTISQPAMGERFQRLVAGLPDPLYPLFEWLAGTVPFYFVTGDGPSSYPVAGFLLGISLVSLLSAALAYPLTLLVTGGSALYASLRALEDSNHS